MGASATATTSTSRVAERIAVVRASVSKSVSVAVAVTCKVKSRPEFSGGVICRPFNWSEVRVAVPLVSSKVMSIDVRTPSGSTLVSR